MEKASFEIIGSENSRLADEGIRLTLTDKMIREGIVYASVENIGSKRLIIKLGGSSRDELEGFRKLIEDNFESWMSEGRMGGERLKRILGNPGLTYTENVYDDELFVLPVGLHSHGLQCEQLRKGVDVFEDIAETNKGLRDANQGLVEEMRRHAVLFEKLVERI